MSLRLINEPGVEPVTLAEIKAQCRVDTSDEDSVLNLCIAAARAKAESLTSRALITQTWEQGLDAFPAAEVELLKPPVQSISTVKYYDSAGVLQTLNDSLYTLDAYTYPGWLLPAIDTAWPTTQVRANAVLVTYFCGYGNSGADVPADLRAWMLMTAAFLFANREAFVIDGRIADVPSRFVDGLLDHYRILKA